MDRAFLLLVQKRLKNLEKVLVDQAMAKVYSVENYAPESVDRARENVRMALAAWLGTFEERVG